MTTIDPISEPISSDCCFFGTEIGKNENERDENVRFNKYPASKVNSQQEQTMISSLTIYDLNLSQAKDCVKCNILTTTVMSFARLTVIALFDSNNVKLHTAGMIRYGWHVRYQNDPRDCTVHNRQNFTVYCAKTVEYAIHTTAV